MKSSTLHRASLSQERMTMLERARAMNMSTDDIPQYRQSSQPVEKAPELDMLYKNFQKTIRKPTVKKTPGVYLGVGFILGAVTMLIISLIVGIMPFSEENFLIKVKTALCLSVSFCI